MGEKITVRKCEIDGCDNNYLAKGFCIKHYSAYKRNGDPCVDMRIKHIGCKIDGCDGRHSAKGYCQSHYQKLTLYGDPNFVSKKKIDPGCKIEDCNGGHKAKGFCIKHYCRYLTHGDPTMVSKTRVRKFIPVKDKFESKFVKGSETECWEWMGTKDKDGYGDFNVNSGPNKNEKAKAHRLSYKLYNGKFDESLMVCHSCDNPGCVNFNHLFLGTAQDNATDMVNKNRSMRGENNNNAKLSEIDIRDIKRALKTKGVKRMDLAKKYGVNPMTITRIKTKESWKHLGD